MKIALTLSALALSVMPAMAYSGCSGDKMKAETASSCAPGATWDAVKSACVENPTS
jgi:hypothetical protein